MFGFFSIAKMFFIYIWNFISSTLLFFLSFFFFYLFLILTYHWTLQVTFWARLEIGEKNCVLVNLIEDTTDPDPDKGDTTEFKNWKVNTQPSEVSEPGSF